MADDPKPGILRNLRIKRVSLVDVGANFDRHTGDGAHIMLAKAAIRKDGPGLGSVHADSTDWRDEYEKATLDSESRNKLPDSAFAAVWTDSKGVKHRKLPIHDAGHLAAARGRIAAADIPADVKAAAQRKIDAATKTNTKEKNVHKSILQKMLGLFGETDPAKRAAGVEEVTKAMADCDDDDEAMAKAKKDKEDADKLEAAKKNIDPAILEAAIAKAVADVAKAHKAEIDVLKAANTTLSSAVEVEKAARQVSEMTTVLKSFKHVPVDLVKDVPVFIKMKASDPVAFERQLEIMKGTDAMLAKSALFSGFGSSQSGGKGDAWGQLEAKADALIEKGAKGLTREQAIEKVLLDPANKELVKQYRAEQQ